MEQHIFGAVLGTSSLLVGWLLHNLSKSRSQELSYLQDVPRFSDFRQLKEYLNHCPGKQADVLVEGVVTKLNNNALKSENASLEGAARLVTTTTYKKVYHQSTDKWTDSSSTIENVCVSVPFSLADKQNNSANVESISKADGFRLVLERVWQRSTPPESRSIGDYATNMTLSEIPNGLLEREYLLVFGSSLGVHGMATLRNQSILNSGTVSLVPQEVSSSINNLIARNEMLVNVLKFLSLVLVVGGGSILVFTVAPLALRALGLIDREESRTRSNH